jgi:nuclear respiratory factor 1
LRQIVINCYKFHGREDLLPAFTEEDEKANATATANANVSTSITTQYTPTVLHTITNPDGTVSIVQVDPNNPIITLPDGTTAHVQGMATFCRGFCNISDTDRSR